MRAGLIPPFFVDLKFRVMEHEGEKTRRFGKKTSKKFEEDEEKLLNLLAEIIVEIIIEETRDERDRLCEDQY